jgi:hypothetical protein
LLEGRGLGVQGPRVSLKLWVEGPLKLSDSIFSDSNINYTDIQEPKSIVFIPKIC